MRIRICPICVLVSLAWISLLVARGLGYAVDAALISMLMGGSVVGIAYTLGRRLDEKRAKLWKLIAIPLGFAVAYTALYEQWLIAAGAAVAAVITGFYFLRSGRSSEQGFDTSELEKKMNECC